MKTLLLFFLTSFAIAGGPRYSYSDAKLNDEMDNIYKDIKSVPLNLRNSSITVGGITVSSLTVNRFYGDTSGTAACTGCVGEVISSTTLSGPVTTSAQFGDIASITLTAGSWEITGIAVYLRNGATWNDTALGISPFSGNNNSGLTYASTYVDYIFTSGTNPTFVTMVLPAVMINTSSSNTYYLKSYVEYSAATPNVIGRITAKRIR